MVHVPDHAHTIRDLASHISRLLELNLRGGNGEVPQLSLDGFLIPYGEEVREVLRDDEVVDVEPLDASAWPVLSASDVPLLAAGKRSAGAVNGAESDVTEGKLPCKRARQTGKGGVEGSPAVAAIGWQPPEGSAASKGAFALAATVHTTAVVGGANALIGRVTEASGTNVALITSKASKAPPKAKPVAPSSSSSSEGESSEGDEDAQAAQGTAATSSAPHPRARGGGRGASFGGGRGRSQDSASAAAVAQAAALATCGMGAGQENVSNLNGSDEGRGIFVGGLSYTVDDAALRKHFEYYGAVADATVVINQRTGKSKGFGFVEFVNVKSRDKVIADGPTQELGGKKVEIKPRQSKGAKGGGKANGKSGKNGSNENQRGKSGKDGKGGKGSKGDKSQRTQSEEDSDEEKPATPALLAPPLAEEPAQHRGGKRKETPAPTPVADDMGDEEAEVQRQMAALGLPVSFTATEMQGGDSDDDEDEDEDEDEAGAQEVVGE